MIKKKEIHKNPFSSVLHTEVDFGNFKKDYYVTYFGPRVGVVIINDGNVLLVKQYRFLIDGSSYEIPGGSVEDGELPEEALIRECQEETGIICENLIPLVRYYPGLDNVDNETKIFYTEQYKDKGTFKPDESEIINLEWVPIKKCLNMIYNEQIIDALTIIGITSYLCKI